MCVIVLLYLTYTAMRKDWSILSWIQSYTYHIDTWYSKIRGKEDIVCLFFFLHATNVYLELKTFNHYY